MNMKVISSILLVAVLIGCSRGQPFVPDAVFQMVELTVTINGFTSPVATSESVFANLSEAEAAVYSSVNFLQDACNRTSTCHQFASCIDVNQSIGIFQCQCNPGFNQTASTQTFPLPDGTLIIPDGTFCPDIDECTGANVCGTGTNQCFNTNGSYSCNCDSGFSYDSANKLCIDYDECANATLNNCHQNATCTDTIGSFNCACNAGFNGDGVNCTEIDECVTLSITCGTNGTCSDPIGETYFCTCDTGFIENATANPKTCEDRDECTDGSNTCVTDASCQNTVGSYTCSCNPGYSGDGTTCTDIDECSSNPCDANANCTNIPGSYNCACNVGFSGNGTVCQVATNDFCYRLSITFDTSVTGDVASNQVDADQAVTDFLNELTTGGIGFSFGTSSHIFETLLGNNVTEFIIRLCLNGSSDSPAEFTSTLSSFTFASNVGGQVIRVSEYNECITNYGNCSTNANCTNTHGDFTCTCFDTHADRSTSGVNGTICDLPTDFSCSSNTVNVTAYKPYFDNLGINETALLLGNCAGTVSGNEIFYSGDCNATVDSNSTHLFYKWNLTNVNESASISVGYYVTIPVTCTFLRSQNISSNISIERKDITFDNDLNISPGDSYQFEVNTFTNADATAPLSGSVPTNEKLYFQLGTGNSLPSNVRIRVDSFETAAADGSSSALRIIESGCSVSITNENQKIVSTLTTTGNGLTQKPIIGIISHFFGKSQITLARFAITACVETGGSSCAPSGCSSARRRRSIIVARVKREDVQSGEVQFAFERAPGDNCLRECGEGGLCVYNALREQVCACAEGYEERNEFCLKATETEASDEGLNKTSQIVLIVLACVLALLICALVAAFFLKRRKVNQKEYDMNYVNTHAIDK